MGSFDRCNGGAAVTFISAESSIEDSEPRELIYISINDGVTTYAHTSATRDIVYDGDTYTAIPVSRGEVTVTMPSAAGNELSLYLPIDHALARRWTQQGVPPKKVVVTIYRQNGGETEAIWVGPLTSMACEGRRAKFRGPSRAGEWMLRQIPAQTVGRRCPYIVYSEACGVDDTSSVDGLALKVTTTVISVSGRDVRVDLGSTDRNGTWAEGGDVYHPTTGERMTVGLQTDANPGVSAVATLTMQMQIIGLAAGHTVQIRRGCANTIDDCNTGLGNRQNFGGLPQMPTASPWTPGNGTEAL